MKALKRIVDDLINGNLVDARKRVKRYSYMKLTEAFQEYAGYTLNKAYLATCYVKSGNNFQAYCDAE